MAVCIQLWTSRTFFLLGTWVFCNCFAVCLQATGAQNLGGGPLLTTSCLNKPQALRFQPVLKARKLFSLTSIYSAPSTSLYPSLSCYPHCTSSSIMPVLFHGIGSLLWQSSCLVPQICIAGGHYCLAQPSLVAW